MFCFAIVIDQAIPGGSYIYSLRFNVSTQGNSDGPATTLPLMEDAALDLEIYQRSTNTMVGASIIVNNAILTE